MRSPYLKKYMHLLGTYKVEVERGFNVPTA